MHVHTFLHACACVPLHVRMRTHIQCLLTQYTPLRTCAHIFNACSHTPHTPACLRKCTTARAHMNTHIQCMLAHPACLHKCTTAHKCASTHLQCMFAHPHICTMHGLQTPVAFLRTFNAALIRVSTHKFVHFYTPTHVCTRVHLRLRATHAHTHTLYASTCMHLCAHSNMRLFRTHTPLHLDMSATLTTHHFTHTSTKARIPCMCTTLHTHV